MGAYQGHRRQATAKLVDQSSAEIPRAYATRPNSTAPHPEGNNQRSLSAPSRQHCI